MNDIKKINREIADIYGRAEDDFLRYYVQRGLAHSQKLTLGRFTVNFAPFKPLPKINMDEDMKDKAR